MESCILDDVSELSARTLAQPSFSEVESVNIQSQLVHTPNVVVPAMHDGSEIQAHWTSALGDPTSSIQPDASSTLNNQLERMILKESGHVDTTCLRRSTRSTRFDGFRVPQPSNIKKNASKVKPRKNTVVVYKSNATAPPNTIVIANPLEDVPAPTPFAIIQEIGTARCGIPPEGLCEEKLLTNPHPAPSSQ